MTITLSEDDIKSFRQQFHDIKNDLNAITGFVQLLQLKYKDDRETVERLHDTMICSKLMIDKLQKMRNYVVNKQDN